MSRRTWHKGPPPHVGWWNASAGRNIWAWRWWDGESWSDYLLEYDTARSAADAAKRPALGSQAPIEWTDYWPKNARVPRIDPRAS